MAFFISFYSQIARRDFRHTNTNQNCNLFSWHVTKEERVIKRDKQTKKKTIVGQRILKNIKQNIKLNFHEY
jgi:hypothetical protein